MDTLTIQRLCQLNKAFYNENNASFSATRQAAWDGWDALRKHMPSQVSSVLDLACGNLRFKSFAEQNGIADVPYYAVDSCTELLPSSADVAFQELDIVEALLEGRLAQDIDAPACDLTVCFGFFHHVPTARLRLDLLDALLQKTAPGGIAAISFWQFHRNPKMLDKATAATARGCAELGLSLEPGDYLLTWNDDDNAYRYCHSFSDAEIDEFARAGQRHASLADRFRADGRSSEMNGYLVFRKS